MYDTLSNILQCKAHTSSYCGRSSNSLLVNRFPSTHSSDTLDWERMDTGRPVSSKMFSSNRNTFNLLHLVRHSGTIWILFRFKFSSTTFKFSNPSVGRASMELLETSTKSNFLMWQRKYGNSFIRLCEKLTDCRVFMLTHESGNTVSWLCSKLRDSSFLRLPMVSGSWAV